MVFDDYAFFLETRVSKTTSADIRIEKGKEANILDAATQVWQNENNKNGKRLQERGITGGKQEWLIEA